MPSDPLHDALDRAHAEIMRLNAAPGFDGTPGHGLNHDCADWTPDRGDSCEICWQFTIDIARAFRGVTKCETCNGSGQRPGAYGTVTCCDDCGGDGEIDPEEDDSGAQ